MSTQPLFDMSQAKPIAAPLFDMSQAQELPSAMPGAPPTKGTLPNKGDTGEGVIAKNLTSFETQLSSVPEGLVKLILAKHWPIVDAKGWSELADDFKSLNPVMKSGGETDWGATAANLLPMLVDMKGGGITESPAAGIVKGAAPAVRAAVRGANTVIEKAPGSIGAAAGAAAGHATGIPGAAEIGGAAGYALGKEVLPQIKIPGEGFGLPNRVAGGPAAAPKYAPGAAGSIAESVAAPADATPAEAAPAAASATARPDYVSPMTGERALTTTLATQPNKILLKIARSRGIDVSEEAPLKPTAANHVDDRIIKKIVDDYSPDELDDVLDTHLEIERMGRHDFGDAGKEAAQTLNLQTYFPDIKIPLAQLLRLRKAIATASAPKFSTVTDLASTLKENAKASAAAKPPAGVDAAPEPVAGDDGLLNALQESLKKVRAQKLAQTQ